VPSGFSGTGNAVTDSLFYGGEGATSGNSYTVVEDWPGPYEGYTISGAVTTTPANEPVFVNPPTGPWNEDAAGGGKNLVASPNTVDLNLEPGSVGTSVYTNISEIGMLTSAVPLNTVGWIPG
jgi:hypothetical protein